MVSQPMAGHSSLWGFSCPSCCPVHGVFDDQQLTSCWSFKHTMETSCWSFKHTMREFLDRGCGVEVEGDKGLLLEVLLMNSLLQAEWWLFTLSLSA